MIIPSIDLMSGKAVQLIQGKKKILERTDIEYLAKYFNIFGEVAVIDLDAAFERGSNELLIKKISKIADIRVGGGIRSENKANRILQMGAKKIILGTKANPKFMSKFNPNRLIAAIDSSKGKVVDKGWKRDTGINTIERIIELEQFCGEFLYTDVDKEGLMQGINLDLIRKIRMSTDNRFTYAGGISTMDDVKSLRDLDINSQIGMAIYTESLDLVDCLTESLDFRKNNGLIPTVVQNELGNLLMLAYSSRDSIRNSIEKRLATYYSRSRSTLWTKGLTSGNIQKLKKIRVDCDGDTIVFTVDQKGNTCHTGRDTCFGERKFEIGDLYKIINERKETELETYTSKLLKNENMIKSKILEEAVEVVNYTDKNNLVWELADLQFFLLTLMVKNDITLDDVTNELWRRKK